MDVATRYAKTADGASIGFATIGEGPPLVCPSNIYGELQAYRLNPLVKPAYDGLARQGFRIVLYDQRGMGSSKGSTGRYDLDARLMDLDAVIAATVDEPTFAMHALASAVPTAVAYASAHPERVAKLILVSGWARGREWYSTVPSMQVSKNLADMADNDWETYTLAMANAVLQYSNSELASQIAATYRASTTPTEFMAYMRASDDIDVFDKLKDIRAPTLLVTLTGSIVGANRLMQAMATEIPDAQHVEVIPGPAWGEAVGDFLHGSTRSTSEAKPSPSAFRTVLFTDLVGHTEMMSRLGDERGRDVLREHERITREVLKANGGTEVKTMGDGFMASFGSVTKAVECAVALQRAFAEREGEPLNVRVGLNAGEPIEEDGDLFGATVILAARIAAKAEAGEILVADTVRGLCSGKGFLFADRGEFVAKGFEEPVRVYEVRWRG